MSQNEHQVRFRRSTVAHLSPNIHPHLAANRPPVYALPSFTSQFIPRDYLTPQRRAEPDFPPTRSSTDPFSNKPPHRAVSVSVIPKVNAIADLRNDVVSRPRLPLTLQEHGHDCTEAVTKKGTPKEIRAYKRSEVAAIAIPAGTPNVQNQSMMDSIASTQSMDSSRFAASDTSLPAKATNDGDPVDARKLLATASSAEAVVMQLLKDKNHAVSQNAQLWKLVDKQRALLLGLNKDLERITKDRDRYKKKVKELSTQTGPQTNDLLAVGRPSFDSNASQMSSPAVTPATEDDRSQLVQTPDAKPLLRMQSSPVDSAMMPSPLHLQQQRAMRIPNTEVTPPRTVSPPSPIVIEFSSPPVESPRELPKLNPMLIPNQPSIALTEPSPLAEKAKSPPTRKPPPRPLNLGSAKEELSLTSMALNGIIDEDNAPADSPPVERGRKKTREDDDRERETLALQEAEARSQSKKNKIVDGDNVLPVQTNDQANFPGPPIVVDQAKPMQADRLMPNITSPGANAQLGSIQSTHLSPPLRSPGLPSSPRPADRSLGSPMPTFMNLSLPMSPRAPVGPFPLSPRAPKQAIPLPGNPRVDGAAPLLQTRPSDSSVMTIDTLQETNRSNLNDSPMSPNEIPDVFRGLVTNTHPDLLLPPNALPSVQVKVASSRLNPSRYSMLSFKTQEEPSVFSLSVFSRSNGNELWRVEKIPTAIPQLDQLLRSRCQQLPKVPDRKLFNGHSPTVVDVRRKALDTYFDDLLDTPMDEQAATMVCRFLSTDVLDPSKVHQRGTTESESSASGKLRKCGYLTKRGKNFGGWKARYFVLEGLELKYHEAPNAAHLGTIKLINSRIGTQLPSEDSLETMNEAQYRHAFLVEEPKKKDVNSHVRHVLCAESDAERDDWVKALLDLVNSLGNTEVEDATIQDDVASLKSLHYADAPSGSAPRMGTLREEKAEASSPLSSDSSTSPVIEMATQESAPRSTNISGPINGVVITNSALWQKKPTEQPASGFREHVKRGIFHFKKHSADSGTTRDTQNDYTPTKSGHAQRNLDMNKYLRPVFGMPISEAVEMYPPDDVDIELPAVVYRCLAYLRSKNAINEEGIFRLSGSNIVIRTLKDRFNTEGDIDLLAEDDYYDIHAIASLLKSYLRELPTPILTRGLHIEFLRVLEIQDPARKISALNTLVHQLPPANLTLLKALSRYLIEVVENSDKNKMSIRNVGIVFSPTLNIPQPVFAMFLTQFDAIFETTTIAAEPQIRTVEISARTNVTTPDDIRSPRHQMFSDLATPAYNQTTFSKKDDGDASPEAVGFTPIQQPRSHSLVPPQPRYQAPQPPASNGDAAYGSLNHMMMPDDTRSAKSKRRESSMIFAG